MHKPLTLILLSFVMMVGCKEKSEPQEIWITERLPDIHNAEYHITNRQISYRVDISTSNTQAIKSHKWKP